MNSKAYYFTDDGIIPNNALPVILYPNVIDLADCSDWLENTFIKNNWLNNWRDIVLPYDHFHSNTHEVLGLGWGNVSLKIGGVNGQVFHLSAGDVIIIRQVWGTIPFRNIPITRWWGDIPMDMRGI